MRILVAIVLVVGGLSAAFALWALRYPEIEAISPPARVGFDPELIRRGEALAAIGGCVHCHTRPGNATYAGGYPLATAFGTIHSTNITPDRETGIGTWSEAAFVRAMREGIDRKGGHLYPAFPYNHYAKVADADLKAIYAYLMTRRAVFAPAAANDLVFPLNVRFLIEGWNLLFLDSRPFAPDPARDAVWNRGAYLAQGLGHCGACHTPRNFLGAEDSDRALAGGEAEAWHAPGLGRFAAAAVPWTVEGLANYLLDGFDAQHGAAAGPMREIVNDFHDQPEEVARAVAVYVDSLRGAAPPPQQKEEALAFAARQEALAPATAEGTTPAPAASGLDRGAAIFARACSSCHRPGGLPVPLALTAAVTAPDPRNLIHVALEGVKAPKGTPDRSMPGFSALSDEELGDLVAFVRARFGRGEPWKDVPGRIRDIRSAAK